MNRRTISTLVALGASSALAIAATPATGAPPVTGSTSSTAQTTARDAIRLVPKSSKPIGANPYIANVPSATKADYQYWRAEMAKRGKARAKSAGLAAAQKAAGVGAKAVLVHDEEEPAGTAGANDTFANAEPIAGFGTGTGKNPRLRILGAMPDLSAGGGTAVESTEDDGAIDLANDSGIDGDGSATATGTIGDGPHGSTGDDSGDFDFYAVDATAGLAITVDTDGSEVDTVVGVYNEDGDLLAFNDDDPTNPLGDFTSALTYPVTESGTYYVAVVGYVFLSDPFPSDPFDSGSGAGGGDEGTYTAALAVRESDEDYYAVDLAKGDVLGGTLTGDSLGLQIFTPSGAERVTSEFVDASSLYPTTSPLPGGGNTTVAYVAEKSGRYVVRVLPTVGTYDVTLEAYRPGTETDRSPKVQTVFLDFDGGRINTGTWGGAGVRTLSGLGSFLGKWGLTRAQENELIRKTTAVVRENIAADAAARSTNDHVQVKVVTSLNSPDIYGQTNVARVFVGGTIAQSGIGTIGIAQFIDPGNFGHEDDALVLLDVLSNPDQGADLQASGNGSSLNTYLEPSSDRIGFVSRALGNVISHEIGHTLGNYHTDGSNSTSGLMDEGGSAFGINLYGVGADRIGGTADDPDRDFVTDSYSLVEGFGGLENTLNVSAWAYVKPRS